MNKLKGIFFNVVEATVLSLIEVNFVKGYKVGGRESECMPDGV